MGPVRLQYVVSYSSQDKRFPADNLLQSSGQLAKGWHSSPIDKSGRIEAEFQLNKASYIHYVDIGNYGSCTVELLVGRSSWPPSHEYVSLLPAIGMMTHAESRSATNSISVRMFTSDDLNKDALNMKWDRIRIICNQPFRKDKPFGLSFLRLANKDPESESPSQIANSSLSSAQIRSPNLFPSSDDLHQRVVAVDSKEELSNKQTSSQTYSRGRTLLNAALKSQPVAKNESENLVIDEPSLEMDILLFLTSKGSEDIKEEFDDYLGEYEAANSVSLNQQQIEIFLNVYRSVFHNNAPSPVILKIPQKSFPTNLFYPKSSFSPKDVKKRKVIENVLLDGEEDGMSFEVDFEKPNCNGKASRRHLENGHTKEKSSVINIDSPTSKRRKSFNKKTNGDLPLIIIEDDGCSGSSTSHSTSHGNKEEFVQFDGSKPGPSKEITYVDCPICRDSFHVDEIEIHAASCNRFPPENIDSSDDEDIAELTTNSRSISANCHSENYLECPVCGNMFQKTVLPSHANICIENCIA